MKIIKKFQRGEIATVLTAISVVVMIAGIITGSVINQRGTRTTSEAVETCSLPSYSTDVDDTCANCIIANSPNTRTFFDKNGHKGCSNKQIVDYWCDGSKNEKGEWVGGVSEEGKWDCLINFKNPCIGAGLCKEPQITPPDGVVVKPSPASPFVTPVNTPIPTTPPGGPTAPPGGSTLTPTAGPSPTPTAGPSPTPGWGIIQGTIYEDLNDNDAVDSTDTKISNISVILKKDSYTDSVTTDSNGAYKFEQLPDGSFTVEVNISDLGQARYTIPEGFPPKLVTVVSKGEKKIVDFEVQSLEGPPTPTPSLTPTAAPTTKPPNTKIDIIIEYRVDTINCNPTSYSLGMCDKKFNDQSEIWITRSDSDAEKKSMSYFTWFNNTQLVHHTEKYNAETGIEYRATARLEYKLKGATCYHDKKDSKIIGITNSYWIIETILDENIDCNLQETKPTPDVSFGAESSNQAFILIIDKYTKGEIGAREVSTFISQLSRSPFQPVFCTCPGGDCSSCVGPIYPPQGEEKL